MMLGTISRRGNLLSLAFACFLTIEGMIDLSLIDNGPIAVCNWCNFSYVVSKGSCIQFGPAIKIGRKITPLNDDVLDHSLLQRLGKNSHMTNKKVNCYPKR